MANWVGMFVLVFAFMASCAKDKPAEVSPGKGAATSVSKNSKSDKSRKAAKPAPKQNKTDSKPVITPDESIVGHVVLVNKNARFVVINFVQGEVPSQGRRLNVYHDGLKVGELRITGPQQDDNTVADIVAGQVQVRDEVREN